MMAEMSGEVKAAMILAATDIIVNQGFTALLKMVTELGKKEVVTIDAIEAVKGELDSAKYFE